MLVVARLAGDELDTSHCLPALGTEMACTRGTGYPVFAECTRCVVTRDELF
jgi:hypothetical protein